MNSRMLLVLVGCVGILASPCGAETDIEKAENSCYQTENPATQILCDSHNSGPTWQERADEATLIFHRYKDGKDILDRLDPQAFSEYADARFDAFEENRRALEKLNEEIAAAERLQRSQQARLDKLNSAYQQANRECAAGKDRACQSLRDLAIRAAEAAAALVQTTQLLEGLRNRQGTLSREFDYALSRACTALQSRLWAVATDPLNIDAVCDSADQPGDAYYRSAIPEFAEWVAKMIGDNPDGELTTALKRAGYLPRFGGTSSREGSTHRLPIGVAYPYPNARGACKLQTYVYRCQRTAGKSGFKTIIVNEPTPPLPPRGPGSRPIPNFTPTNPTTPWTPMGPTVTGTPTGTTPPLGGNGGGRCGYHGGQCGGSCEYPGQVCVPVHAQHCACMNIEQRPTPPAPQDPLLY